MIKVGHVELSKATALRKDIAALEARLVDPRNTLRDAIEAMTRIKRELISAFVAAPGDTQLAHTIEPFISDLVRMRNARNAAAISSRRFRPRRSGKNQAPVAEQTKRTAYR